MPETLLTHLSDHGQSERIDFLSRPFIQDGDLAALADQGADTLKREGVERSTKSFRQMFDDINARRAQLKVPA